VGLWGGGVSPEALGPTAAECFEPPPASQR
jgi:hypothetical protein